MLKHFKRMSVYEPPKGTPDEEQYARLVTLAHADLARRGFSESAVEKFLTKRCAVPFSILLEVPPAVPFAIDDNDQIELWVQSLAYAKEKIGTGALGM